MDARQKEFKWFGEGFDGFPKHLPEDCVEYFVYIIDSKLKDREIRSQLRQIQTSASNLTKKLLKGYIWQRQSFSLDLIHENGNSMAAFSSQHRSLELSILDRRTELPPWSDKLWRLD
jgi:tRNA splicing ligase